MARNRLTRGKVTSGISWIIEVTSLMSIILAFVPPEFWGIKKLVSAHPWTVIFFGSDPIKLLAVLSVILFLINTKRTLLAPMFNTVESARDQLVKLAPMTEVVGGLRDRLAGLPGAYTTIYKDRLSFFRATRQIYEEAASSNRETDKTLRWARLGGYWGQTHLNPEEQTEFESVLQSANKLRTKGWAIRQLLAVGDHAALQQVLLRTIQDTIKADNIPTEGSVIEIKLINNPTSKYSLSPFITDQEVILAIYQQHDTFARSGLILRSRDAALVFTQYFENLWGLESADGVVFAYNSRIREEIARKVRETDRDWSTCVKERMEELFQSIGDTWFPSNGKL